MVHWATVTQFTFTLVLLFIPGIICALVVENLVPARPWSATRLALYSFVLGLITYVPYTVFLAAWRWEWPPPVGFLDSLSHPGNQPPAISVTEVMTVTGVAVPVGLLVSFLRKHHWLHRFAKTIKVSERFGDLDVWSHTFNSSDLTDSWVVVRDIKHNLAYEGWVNAFSETADDNELLLREVRVYENSTAKLLYDVPSLYVSRPRSELTIEFRPPEGAQDATPTTAAPTTSDAAS